MLQERTILYHCVAVEVEHVHRMPEIESTLPSPLQPPAGFHMHCSFPVWNNYFNLLFDPESGQDLEKILRSDTNPDKISTSAKREVRTRFGQDGFSYPTSWGINQGPGAGNEIIKLKLSKVFNYDNYKHTFGVDLDDGLGPAGDVDGRAQLSPPKRLVLSYLSREILMHGGGSLLRAQPNAVGPN
ncbi:hypothetical protein GGX14DRAFT_397507 [Mycena pura]|uniref:Uncharacterized protein n=1 Tax=Mycena pura TaxID=153505 RepID=A0AAD6VFR0_9AGAR|nr:hypothetical protein GGX14DRAFT_397507 [Mycena pura]